MVAGIIIKDNVNNIQTTADTISANYNLNTKAFIVHTKGIVNNVKERISLLTGEDYNNIYNPSFSFPIDKKNKIEVGIKYNSIYIGNDDKIMPGFNNLRISNNGLFGEKINLSITKK